MSTIVNLDGVRAEVSPQAMKRGRYTLVSQIVVDMNSFVSKRNNILRQNAHIKSDDNAILYETKYARRQFYLNGKKYTTLGTGPRWNLKAESLYMPPWRETYLKGVGIQ